MVQGMKDVPMIFAGYTAEMELFLTSNPGIKSRITRTFIFEDYTCDQMAKIFMGMVEKHAYDYVVKEKEAVISGMFNEMFTEAERAKANGALAFFGEVVD